MIIVKIGGSKNINWPKIISDLKTIVDSEKVILVHGANQIRDDLACKLGQEKQVVESPSGITSVYTDQEALETFLMAYAGKVNKTVVGEMQKQGVNAIGLTGADGRIWEGEWKQKIMVKKDGKIFMRSGNLTGNVKKVNSDLLLNLLEGGYLPVLTPPAISFEGQLINTDNDTAIAAMASHLPVTKIVTLFEAPGLLKNVEDPNSKVGKIMLSEINEYKQFAIGTMQKKLMGAQTAMRAGVESIYWGDVRLDKPITSALAGKGTVILNQ